MTKVKLCGLSRPCEIEAANELKPDYIGFVFAKKSKRYIAQEQVALLKKRLDPAIQAVGVFVNETPETVAGLLENGIIDIAQLHGGENAEYIRKLRGLTKKPIIKAFRIESADDIKKAEKSSADYILLDSGAGTGTIFDWNLLPGIQRPYFLAGGLSPENAEHVIRQFMPYAVDVSSGIETGGVKDIIKMTAFVAAVRKEDQP